MRIIIKGNEQGINKSLGLKFLKKIGLNLRVKKIFKGNHKHKDENFLRIRRG